MILPFLGNYKLKAVYKQTKPHHKLQGGQLYASPVYAGVLK